MNADIYVGNLDYRATEVDINELFSQVGLVKEVRISCRKAKSGKMVPAGYAFVTMQSRQDADKAKEMLDLAPFMNRNILVRDGERGWAAKTQKRRQGLNS